MSYSLPSAQVDVNSQQVVAPAAPGSYAVIGVTSRGPTTPKVVSVISDLVATYGIGPAVKEAAYQLGRTGVPIVMRRILPTAQAAQVGALNVDQWTGDNPPTITGTPTNYHSVIVEITSPGAVNVAQARYSLNGGTTFSSPATLSGPLALGNSGLTFTPGAGNLDGSVACKAYPAAQAVVGLAITRAASSTAVPSIAGTPLDVYEFRLEVLQGGTLGQPTPAIRYRYSLDGGRTWTREFGLGSALAVAIRDGKDGISSEEASGLTLTLGTAGQTLEVADTITFDTTETAISAADALQALDDIRAGSFAWEFAHVVGPVNGAKAASIGSRFQSWASSAVGSARFTWGLWSTRRQYVDETEGDYIEAVVDADYGALLNPRVSAWAGHGPRVTCPITQRRNHRPVACVLLPRILGRPIEEEPMRVATGPLPSDVVLYESGQRIAHDSRQNVALHAARFGTLRTHEDLPGIYVTRSNTFDVENGQESRIPRRRVLDLATRTFQRVLVQQIGAGLELNPADQTIDEVEAQLLEQATNDELAIVLGGRVSGYRVVVNRTTPVTAATPLKEIVSVQGLEYIDKISGEIGFVARLPQEV